MLPTYKKRRPCDKDDVTTNFRLTLLILFLEFFHLPTNIKTNISLMLVYTQFLTDFMAYNVVPFYLDIFSNFLTA